MSKRRRAAPRKPRAAQPPAPMPIASDVPALPWAVGLFVAALVTYTLTLYRSVPGGDSGELILVAHTLGVAHPPGYPLFTLLGKLFSLIPYGTIAWRINLLSAVCDAAAAAVLLLATARWTGTVWAGVLAAGLFAFSPLTWSYAVGAEVFALNNLFCAGLLWLVVRYFRQPDERVAKLGAFWCGLGLSNHHLFVLFALPAVVAVLWRGQRTLVDGRKLAVLAGLFGAGLLPYAYLPLASAGLPRTGWGDQTTLDGLIGHFLRRDYGTFDLAVEGGGGASTFPERLRSFLGHVPKELGWWGLALSLIGAWAGLRARPGRAVHVLVAIMLLVYLGLFLGRANLPLKYPLHHGIQARFWQQANLALFFWAGVGLWALSASLGTRFRRAVRLGLPVAALAGAALPLALHFRAQDRSTTTAVSDFARAVLETLPRDALLICSGDYLTHTIRYLQDHEGVRDDVRVVDHITLQQPWEARRVAKYEPDVVLPGTHLSPQAAGGSFNLGQFLDANAARFPIFVANGIRIPDASHEQNYYSWPIGLVQWMGPKATELEFDEWLRRDAEALMRFTPPSPGRHAEDSWEHETLRQHWFSRYVHGVMLLNYASRHGNDRRASQRAVQTLEAVVEAGIFVQPEVFRNLGGAYMVHGVHEPQALEAMRRSFARYLELAPQAADREEIRALMGR